jgi:competence protein ComEC
VSLDDKSLGGSRTGSRAGSWAGTWTGTWPLGGARAGPGAVGAPAEFVIPARVRAWAAEEVRAGRLLPWFAVAYGFGIVLYFTAEREPAWWAATALAAASGSFAVLLRRRHVASIVALGIFGVATGFAAATVKTALIDHPVLRFSGIMAQTPQGLR